MKLVMIAGPNGAGKTTAAPRLLRGPLRVSQFVNADTIAQGLSAFEPEESAIAAGRIMLRRLNELAVPEATVRRRYHRGLQNFFRLYRSLADTWWFYDNAGTTGPRLVAGCFPTPDGTMKEEVIDPELWRTIQESYS